MLESKNQILVFLIRIIISKSCQLESIVFIIHTRGERSLIYIHRITNSSWYLEFGSILLWSYQTVRNIILVFFCQGKIRATVVAAITISGDLFGD